mmetsp:Transcript_4592/g.17000  ORF Transcript_4592/g.17000 Transcript_4592/m.17000 type:complete len:963 (+) Transcript_4592:215-3103(+)
MSAGRTCLACSRSKVKCDRETPCARCVRLGLRCVRNAPSRRGARRVVLAPQVAELQLFAPMEHDAVADTSSRIERETVRNGPAATEQLRAWALVALQRKSTTLLARTLAMATRARVDLQDLLLYSPTAAAANKQGAYAEYLPRGNPFASTLNFFQDAEDAESEAEEVCAKRARGEAVPWTSKSASRHLASTHSLPRPFAEFLQAPGAVCWGRVSVDGFISHFASPKFAAEYMDAAAMDKIYARNESDLHEHFMDAASSPMISWALAQLYKSLATASASAPCSEYLLPCESEVAFPVVLIAKDASRETFGLKSHLGVFHGGRVIIAVYDNTPLPYDTHTERRNEDESLRQPQPLEKALYAVPGKAQEVGPFNPPFHGPYAGQFGNAQAFGAAQPFAGQPFGNAGQHTAGQPLSTAGQLNGQPYGNFGAQPFSPPQSFESQAYGVAQSLGGAQPLSGMAHPGNQAYDSRPRPNSRLFAVAGPQQDARLKDARLFAAQAEGSARIVPRPFEQSARAGVEQRPAAGIEKRPVAFVKERPAARPVEAAHRAGVEKQQSFQLRVCVEKRPNQSFEGPSAKARFDRPFTYAPFAEAYVAEAHVAETYDPRQTEPPAADARLYGARPPVEHSRPSKQSRPAERAEHARASEQPLGRPFALRPPAPAAFPSAAFAPAAAFSATQKQLFAPVAFAPEKQLFAPAAFPAAAFPAAASAPAPAFPGHKQMYAPAVAFAPAAYAQAAAFAPAGQKPIFAPAVAFVPGQQQLFALGQKQYSIHNTFNTHQMNFHDSQTAFMSQQQTTFVSQQQNAFPVSQQQSAFAAAAAASQQQEQIAFAAALGHLLPPETERPADKRPPATATAERPPADAPRTTGLSLEHFSPNGLSQNGLSQNGASRDAPLTQDAHSRDNSLLPQGALSRVTSLPEFPLTPSDSRGALHVEGAAGTPRSSVRERGRDSPFSDILDDLFDTPR